MSIWWIGGLTIFVLVGKNNAVRPNRWAHSWHCRGSMGRGAFIFGVRIALTVASVERATSHIARQVTRVCE